ncbi:MAG: hypothetical protein MI861_11280 [Pirellulales bacterium]|nr:hypothetical protein [Pirellulales bacterium]
MPRIPRPWSKKRGERIVGNAVRGVAGEVVFYALVFLVGIFGLSLVLISHFAPHSAPDVPSGALESNLSFWIFGILSVAAIASGATGLIFRLMRVGASSERRSVMASRAGSIEVIGPTPEDGPRLPHVPRGRLLTDSPGERLTYRLAADKPEGGIAGPATLALLWNSVWFVLLAVVVSGYWYGQPRNILAGLLIPFGGIGIWSFRFFLSQLRQHAGVGSTIVEISDHPLYPGQAYRIFVSQMGKLQLQRLKIQLTCEEETFFRQGTDVRVERYVAFTKVLHKERDVVVDPKQPWEQQLTLDLPENVMHSFVGSHNAIRWKIDVIGEARPWPSFCRSFPVVVHPPGLPPRRNPR